MKKPLFRYQKFVIPIWFCIAGTVNAQTNDCDPGIYVGKIGNVPITMSLDPLPDESPEASRYGFMYYRVSMGDMLLKQESMRSAWIEFDSDSKPSGRITMTCQNERLIGEWSSLDGKKHFPMIASRGHNENYNARRFSALKPIKAPIDAKNWSEVFHVEGPKTLGSSKENILGIQLFGTEAGVAKVNRSLWANLLDNMQSLIDCSHTFRRRTNQTPGDLQFEQRLLHTAGVYVVVSSRIGYECSWGMQSGHDITSYRLTDGLKVNSKLWFKQELNALWEEDWRTTPLTKLVLKAGRTQIHKEDTECFKAATYNLSDVYPSREGFVFRGSLPTPFQHCQGSVDVTLPFVRLAPFLSAEGKRAVQTIEKMSKP